MIVSRVAFCSVVLCGCYFKKQKNSYGSLAFNFSTASNGELSTLNPILDSLVTLGPWAEGQIGLYFNQGVTWPFDATQNTLLNVYRSSQKPVDSGTSWIAVGNNNNPKPLNVQWWSVQAPLQLAYGQGDKVQTYSIPSGIPFNQPTILSATSQSIITVTENQIQIFSLPSYGGAAGPSGGDSAKPSGEDSGTLKVSLVAWDPADKQPGEQPIGAGFFVNRSQDSLWVATKYRLMWCLRSDSNQWLSINWQFKNIADNMPIKKIFIFSSLDSFSFDGLKILSGLIVTDDGIYTLQTNTPMGTIVNNSNVSLTSTPLIWQENLAPFIENHCARCHIQFTDYTNFNNQKSQVQILVKSGSMPPADQPEAKSLTPENRKNFLDDIGKL